ncbi:hypothetical protein [Pontibacter kalidii]|nr:hypothetical protein [Pontibacter kalidii]
MEQDKAFNSCFSIAASLQLALASNNLYCMHLQAESLPHQKPQDGILRQ